MTTTHSAASSTAQGGAGSRLIDTFWVLASWFSAYGMQALLGSPVELVTLPRLLPYGLGGLAVAVASASLGTLLGLYRAGGPLIGLRVVAAVVCVRAAELAALVGLVTVLGIDASVTAILLAHSVLACTAVLGWRASLRLLAPYGFDFSRLPRRQRRTASALYVTVRDSGVRARQGEDVRRLPRRRSH
jgi:hypothetical protein